MESEAEDQQASHPPNLGQRGAFPGLENGCALFFTSRRRHTSCSRDWSSDVCSSDLTPANALNGPGTPAQPGAIVQQAPGATQPDGTAAGTTPPASTGTPVGTDQSDSGSSPQPIPTSDTSAIIGGNIIRVGSKIDQSSVIVDEKAKNFPPFRIHLDPGEGHFGGGAAGDADGKGIRPAGPAGRAGRAGRKSRRATDSPHAAAESSTAAAESAASAVVFMETDR